jgi:Lon protease-like protein
VSNVCRRGPAPRGAGGALRLPPVHYAFPVDEIGLFPLPVVLVPGEQAPLHIFEERYRELISECLEDDVHFGLVLADDDGIREIGTRAAVVEVLERFPDGRLNIVVEGRERFRLLELTEGRSFATAEVDDVEDEGDEPTDEERARCLAAYDRVVAAAATEVDELDRDAGDLAFQIAARIDLGPELKQSLIELRSERERILRLEKLLDRAADAVAREREIRERAASNGRVEAL